MNAFVTVHTGHAGGGCFEVQFAEPLSGGGMQALLQLPYQQVRQRLHVIKQQLDDLSSTPGTHLMPVVAVTNAAAKCSQLLRCTVLEVRAPSSAAHSRADILF